MPTMLETAFRVTVGTEARHACQACASRFVDWGKLRQAIKIAQGEQ